MAAPGAQAVARSAASVSRIATSASRSPPRKGRGPGVSELARRSRAQALRCRETGKGNDVNPSRLQPIQNFGRLVHEYETADGFDRLLCNTHSAASGRPHCPRPPSQHGAAGRTFPAAADAGAASRSFLQKAVGFWACLPTGATISESNFPAGSLVTGLCSRLRAPAPASERSIVITPDLPPEPAELGSDAAATPTSPAPVGRGFHAPSPAPLAQSDASQSRPR